MKKIQDFRVKAYEWLNEDNYILTLQSDQPIEAIAPGNFAEIMVPHAADVFLRRPISVLDADYTERSLSFYIKAIGKGTRKLGMLHTNETVNVIYPLGNSFGGQPIQRALIVGGGSGIAPFVLLGRALKEKGVETTFLLGARSKRDIFLTDQFARYGKVVVTTEDGSMGEKGLVTQHSVFADKLPFDKIFTCGPDPMMKAVARLAAERNIPCEASLENMMACGIGACLCCITPTTDGNKCVCTEGPIFNTKELSW